MKGCIFTCNWQYWISRKARPQCFHCCSYTDKSSLQLTSLSMCVEGLCHCSFPASELVIQRGKPLLTQALLNGVWWSPFNLSWEAPSIQKTDRKKRIFALFCSLHCSVNSTMHCSSWSVKHNTCVRTCGIIKIDRVFLAVQPTCEHGTERQLSVALACPCCFQKWFHLTGGEAGVVWQITLTRSRHCSSISFRSNAAGMNKAASAYRSRPPR